MKSVIGKSLALGLLAGAAAVAACSTQNPGPSVGSGTANPPSTEEGTGSVGFQYSLAGGEQISSLSYTLTNGTNTYSNTENVADAGVISFVIPGVAAGSGYSITITANSADGKDTCEGATGLVFAADAGAFAGVGNATPFGVVARQTVQVNVQLVCFDNANAQQGGVQVNAFPNCCATWDTAIANPGTASTSPPSNTSVLSANASGPCASPDGGQLVNCAWTVGTGGVGTVGATTTDNNGNFVATYTCGSAASADTLNLDCTDGPLQDGGSCPSSSTHFSTTVVCGAVVPCTQSGESGVQATPNTAAGTCTTAFPANSGTADTLGNFCCETAAAFCGSAPVASPFSATGTCATGFINNGQGCCVPFSCNPPSGDQTACNAYVAANVATDSNTSGSTCTGTEDVLFQVDGTGACLGCLFGAGCLDDTQGDSNTECEDTAQFAGNAGTEAQCLATLECGMGLPETAGVATGCGVASNAPAKGVNVNAYCGNETTSTCTGTGPIGTCAAQEAAGFNGSAPATIINNFAKGAFASGVANALFACGHKNCSTSCGL